MPIADAERQRFAVLRALFEAALERPAAERDAWLTTATDDEALRAEVRALIAAHESTSATLTPIGGGGADPLDRREGLRLGGWALGRLIGVGGMGAVYEARRADAQFEMRAAIKFVRHGAHSRAAVARFRRERQILATLTHPHIASLLDGGVAPDGAPYLVMEYVDGVPITAWCEAHALDVDARIRLFLQVCDAVQHAHQRLVVHRDLKPANVLVTADGKVKLLDFGIAALLREPTTADAGDDDRPSTDRLAAPVASFTASPTASLTASLTATRGDARIFTPDYAAPEQLLGEPVSTATDVYAMGVMLYELLTGRRPFTRGDDFQPARVVELAQASATRPSSVVQAERLPRGTGGAGALRRRLAGDLDAIVLTALRTEPSRRYASAEALGRDLRDLLDGRPVTARPDTLGYRLRTFARRHTVETASAALLAVSLVGGIVATTREAQRAEREAQRAEAERARAIASRDFVTTMLGAADPGALGRDVTVREVLDSAAVRADTLDAQPALAADVRTTIGDTYVGLGEFERATVEYAKALALRARLAPQGDTGTVRLLVKQGTSVEYAGEYQRADSIYAAADSLQMRVAADDEVLRATILESRARMQAELGDLPTMERMLRDVLAIRRRAAPDDEQQLAYTLNNLAFVVGAQGQFAEADSLHGIAVDLSARAFGADHPVTATAIAQHAHAKEMVGNVAASDSLYRIAIAMRRRLLGSSHPDYAWTLFQYSQFLVRREAWQDALTAGREVLALRGGALPEAHPAIHTALQAVGLALAGLDSLPEAERYLRESLALREQTLPAGHWLIASGRSVLGAHLARLRRFAEGERLLLDAQATLVASRGAESPQAQDTFKRLAALYDEWGRPAEAARWRARVGAGAD